MPSQRKTTAPSPQQVLSGQEVPRIPGKYAISERCCRKIQNGPSMVHRLGTLNVESLTGRSMWKSQKCSSVEGLKSAAFRKPDGNRMVSVMSTQTKKDINDSGMVKRRPKMVLEFLSENR
ncbi:hypothetical protein HELRODRAFT_164039 [Helobdella robusta]|uniref:Uncharacterized protein n=1 Tax=Helobdella robusta TaxID=6412 RepID=T1EUT2_HELRO|nr:hypothetical protein HELRODRAFT_164039 [Helobdella robusta]ESN94234.1 hypothetical protein HELRODRAFT_164039 [Helobdella robusta]